MNTSSQFYSDATAMVQPPPTRFTLTEWHLNNRARFKNCVDQQQLADKILAECERTTEIIDEISLMNKRDVDHKIEEKIKDIEFVRDETLKQRKEVIAELDNLSLYNERISDALVGIRTALDISKKCIIVREGRISIDLCHDDVDRELVKEAELIESAINLLNHVTEQVTEQARRLRSNLYFMDRDLEDKGNVLTIDNQNLTINEKSLNLSMYHGFTPLDPANITVEEWRSFSFKNIERSAKEINTGCELRAYVDNLLKHVIDDLLNQYTSVNEAFRRRIEETKEVKLKLEVNHSEIAHQANEMTRNILKLEQNLSKNEGFMALAHTRLGNRCQRPGMELCRDLVETNLVNEVIELRSNCNMVQRMLIEAQTSLRFLLKTQIQLEEDLNVKTNTLKIDEVDCTTLRQSMAYHYY